MKTKTFSLSRSRQPAASSAKWWNGSLRRSCIQSSKQEGSTWMALRNTSRWAPWSKTLQDPVNRRHFSKRSLYVAERPFATMITAVRCFSRKSQSGYEDLSLIKGAWKLSFHSMSTCPSQTTKNNANLKGWNFTEK